MRATPLVFLFLFACGPTEPADGVASSRSGLISQQGLPGSQLGVSATACPGGVYFGGAPGTGSVVSASGAAFPPYIDVPSGVGTAVRCGRSSTGALVLFAGGDGGAFQLLPDGGATLVRSFASNGVAAPVTALDYDGEKLLIGAPPFASMGASVALIADGGNGFGAAVLRAGGYSLVGDPSTSTVSVFKSDGTLNSVIDPGLPGSRFGAALAFGVVTPGAQPQLLVGAPGEQRVHLFNFVNGAATSAGFVPTTGFFLSSGFGSAITLERLNLRDGGVLNAVWVAADDAEELDGFIAGHLLHVEPTPIAGNLFAASIAAAPGKVVIGAPKANGGNGALYFLDSPFARPAEVRGCTASTPCSINCRAGTCLANLVCIEDECTSGNCGCAPGYACNEGRQVCEEIPDAGEPDAGEPDAGKPDAGEPDAGEPDAGEPDAGAPDAGAPDAGLPDGGATVDAGTPEPVRFTTRGCSAAPMMTLAWLAALLFRRRFAGQRATCTTKASAPPSFT